MTMIPDGENNPPEKALFRVEQESLDQGRTWNCRSTCSESSKLTGRNTSWARNGRSRDCGWRKASYFFGESSGKSILSSVTPE